MRSINLPHPARGRRTSVPSKRHSVSRVACEALECRRLLAAGDPDLSFSGDGRTALNFPGSPFEILDTALQSDGKIVLAGKKGLNAAVARLNSDGTLDTTFGSGGLFEYGSIQMDLAEARGVAMDADGRIVVCGFAVLSQLDDRFAVGRLTASGARDSSFGGGLGIVRTPLGDFSRALNVAIQTDGKIVAAGRAGDLGSNGDMVVARYHTDGMLDNGFAGDGTAVIEIHDSSQEANAVTIDYTGNPLTNPRYGSIVVAGKQFSPSAFALARLNPNGTADNTFSGDGRLISPSLSPHPVEFARGVVVQPGGKIVAAGTSQNRGVDPTESDFLMARYNVNGSLDTSFGPNGTGAVELDLGGFELGDDLTTGYLGGLVLSGSRGGGFALLALKANGQLDNRFSDDGILTTSIPTSALGGVHVAATGSAIAPIRRLVVAGGNQVARIVDVGSVIVIGSGDPEGAEEGQEPAHFFVGRTEPVPFAERVFLGISGTATPPNAFPIRPRDYNGTNITIGGPTAGPTFVDIPAHESLVGVTITPVDDTLVEGDETAIFSVASHITYDIGTPPRTTLVIRDNDVVGGPTVASSVFLFEIAPQRVQFTFNQDVGSSLSAADFQVSGPSGSQPFSFSYDAVSNTATLSCSSILPDGDFTARAIAAGITNAQGQPMPADHVLEFFFLRGDANRDRQVNLQDFNRLASNFGQSNRTFSQGDFNYDTIVNLQDFNILASRFGQVLAPGVSGRAPADRGRGDEDLRELLNELV